MPDTTPREIQNSGVEPVAVVGLSCRFPGGADPDEFWRTLAAGRDTVGDVPAGRADLAAALRRASGPDTPLPLVGGFLPDVAGFDAAFFGISPAEARAVDPRQRLVLELAWEAIESARCAPTALRGTRTGVFVGAIGDDYATLLRRRGEVTPHTLAGLHRAMIANRISYLLHLRGPSLIVDSAQSSSLVAVHMACETLRNHESDIALAGGVGLNLAADSTRAVAAFGGLSARGRCSVFGADADGYVRGEGGGMLMLKRLSDAVAAGDPVWAVLHGSATNSDGATTTLPTPDPESQGEVIRAAHARAGIDAADVQYIELHGTGTRVGDPVEAAGLRSALAGRDVDADPVVVGSVKTNIGHLEGAAGIAGLIKTILCVRHRTLVPSLHGDPVNPDIDLVGAGLTLADSTAPWPHPERRLLAGVSSFGMGGSNCHVVVGEAPVAAVAAVAAVEAADTADAEAPAVLPWIVTAASRGALAGQAARLEAHLSGCDHAPRTIAASLHRSRAMLGHRAVVLADGVADARAGLAALRENRPAASVVVGDGVARAPRPVFVMPGQGSQWVGMGRRLITHSAAFAAALAECDEALAPYLDFSVVQLLVDEDSDALATQRTDVVQPVLWAFTVALARLWQSVGVQPAAVVGHSQGEVGAATVAGALTLADGARVVAVRSRAMQRIAGAGATVSVLAPHIQVRADLERWAGRLSVAAVNGPAQTIVAGDPAAIEELLTDYAGRIRARRVGVDLAAHSPQVDVLADEVRAGLAGIAPQPGTVPFCSTVSGTWHAGDLLDADYWLRNMRQEVRFATAVERLLADGHDLFVEVSPHPVMTEGLSQLIEADGRGAVALSTLRRDHDDARDVLRAIATAFVHGADVEWSAVCDDVATTIDLPTYAFDRSRHWADAATNDSVAGNAARTPESQVRDPRPATADPAAALRAQVLAARDPVRAVLGHVRTRAAAVLGHDDDAAVPAGATFKSLGVDSATSLALRNDLVAAFGVALPAAALYDHPTPRALAGLVAAAVSDAGAPPDDTPPDDTPPDVISRSDSPERDFATLVAGASAAELLTLIDSTFGRPVPQPSGTW